MTDAGELAALVASRLCHDLISPLGAIGNGVELMALEGGRGGPELALIGDSAAQAAAKVRFLRVAFGAAAADQRTGAAEVRALVAEAWRGGRLAVEWAPQGDHARREVRLALLAVLCLESAMPRGGRIVADEAGGRWTVAAEAPRLRPDAGPFAALATAAGPAGVAAGTVQFALLHTGAQALRRRIAVEVGDTRAAIAF